MLQCPNAATMPGHHRKVNNRTDKLCVSVATRAAYVKELRRAYYAVITLTDAARKAIRSYFQATRT